MSKPKFSVGDLVAVCAIDCEIGCYIAIPRATVDEVACHDGNEVRSFDGHEFCPIGFYYSVDEDAGTMYPEKHLRPINPGEYDEDEEEELTEEAA